MIKHPFPLLNALRYDLKYRPQLKYVPKLIVYRLVILCSLPFFWYEMIRYRKAIDNFEFKHPPLFILGHWRSGTTYLQRLLALDPNVAYLTQYDSFYPRGAHTSGKFLKPLNTFLFKITGMKHPSHHVPMQVDFPSEEDIALVTSGYPHSAMWGHMYCNKADFFYEKYLISERGSREFERFKTMYKFLANYFGFFNPDKFVVLKTPVNTVKVPELVDIYPDAKFVYIERNPKEVYFSYIKLLKANREQWLHEMPEEKMESYFVRWYPKVMQHYYESRDLIPAENLVELRFSDLCAQPIEKLHEIYQQFGMPISDELDNIYKEFLEEHHQTQRHFYDKDLPTAVQQMFDEFHKVKQAVVA